MAKAWGSLRRALDSSSQCLPPYSQESQLAEGRATLFSTQVPNHIETNQEQCGPASAPQAADWLRLAKAWGSLI